MKKKMILLIMLLSVFVSYSTQVYAYTNTEIDLDNVSAMRSTEYENDTLDSSILKEKEQISSFEPEFTLNLDKNSHKISADEAHTIKESIDAIENELSKKGINVLSELSDQVDYYKKLLLSENSDDKRDQINYLIDSIESLANQYTISQNARYLESNDETYTTTSMNVALISPVIAYFNSNGWYLAAELLTHMANNSTIDSIYRPINASIVTASPVYQNIVNGSIKYGFSNFTNDGTQHGGDLYYAIHAFRFTKSDSNRLVVITDRYDFALVDYDSVAGVTVYAMTVLQNSGILNPYYTIIERSISNPLVQPATETIPTMGNYSRMVERNVTLGAGEYKEYYIRFSIAGIKTLQTFGYNDAYLELYNESGTRIAYNDDSGYSLNASLTYDFLANVQYRIRVRFWSSIKHGEVKLVITPSTTANYNNIPAITFQGWWIFGSIYTDVNTKSNYVDFYTYTPSENGVWSIKTTKIGSSYLDTYLYILDPRTTFLMSESMPYNVNTYNDDGSPNLQASFLIYFPKNFPVLIIASTYNLSTSGSFKIEIARFSMSV